MFPCHCSGCGAEMSRASAERVSACCALPRCNSAGRARYVRPGAGPGYRCDERFVACCDAGALEQMASDASAGRGSPRRVALW